MTKILKIDAENSEEDKVLIAAEHVKRGEVLVYPTDTVYGLGCAIASDSVEKVFDIKRRSRDAPLSVAFSGLGMVGGYVEIDDDERDFIQTHIKEPYTFVVKKKNKIPDIVTAGKDTVGVRIPNHLVAREIIEKAGIPIISTSANVSGEAAPASVDEIADEILEKADLIVDSGPCKTGKPSKVIDVKSGRTLRD